MRTLFLSTLSLLVLSTAASAQEAGGYSAGPSKSFQVVIKGQKPSPVATQDRLFAGTRFWLLDPGRYEVEQWWDHKFGRDGSSEGVLKTEIEIGLAPHLQLDLYQNFTVGDPGFHVEGNQIELRYAFARTYNEIPLNPVLYLEWHPRKNAQDRAEMRLLLGGDLPARGVWAANVYGETNVDDFNAPGNEGADAEIGVSGALSFPVVGDAIRVGAETQVGVDQHGDPDFHPVWTVGPNLLFADHKHGLKLTATSLFGVLDHDPRVELLLIAGYQFERQTPTPAGAGACTGAQVPLAQAGVPEVPHRARQVSWPWPSRAQAAPFTQSLERRQAWPSGTCPSG